MLGITTLITITHVKPYMCMSMCRSCSCTCSLQARGPAPEATGKSNLTPNG